MREGIQDVQRIAKHYNTVDGNFLQHHQNLEKKNGLKIHVFTIISIG